ncbi:teichoic acid biosynthesis protein C [Nonomuraea longicatena]|uniref:P68 RBP/TagC-like beta-propeller domain-containing protein n=1 Tax=Nonomuraea longicatena TaxID=83682 RepID=A0ABN1Q341_9ACTN
MTDAMSRRGLLKLGAGFAAASTVAGLVARPAQAVEGRFNLASPSYSFIWKNPLEDPSIMQSFAFDTVNNHIYTIQVMHGTGARARGDLTITKLSATGANLGHMYVRDAGHGVSMAVEPVGNQVFIWTEADAQPFPNEYSFGRTIIRFPFQNATEVDSKAWADKYVPIPGATVTTPSIDPSTNRITMQYWLNGAEPRRYAVYSLADFKARRFNNPVYQFAEPPLVPAGQTVTHQGWATYGEYLYTLDGTYAKPSLPEGDTYITCIDMRTAAVVHRSFSQAGISLDGREPEGMSVRIVNGQPQLCFGFGSGPTGARVASMFYKSAWM